MKIGPKYKIARRLGAPIFEKTQTQKFAASEQKKNGGGRKFVRNQTEFAVQMKEKQKARLSYGVTNKQFTNYVRSTFADQGAHKSEILFKKLENRLDNVVYRAGFAPTRQAARQMVSHGHIKVGGKKITVPSHSLTVGDEISVKESSAGKGLFTTREEQISNHTAPSWLKVNAKTKTIKVEGEPKLEQQELLFDLSAVLEFFSR